MAATAEAYYGRLLTGAGEHTGTRPTSHGRGINYQRLEDGVGGGCEWRDVSVAGGDVGECVWGGRRRRWCVSPGEAGLGTLVSYNSAMV